jgi:hypothetical protein
MSDTTRHDHLALLLADAERALDGLRLSLGQPLQDMPQAALHALDLATALSRLSLAAQADVVQALAQELSLGHPNVLGVARDIVTGLEHTLQELTQASTRPDPQQPLPQWAEWKRQLTSAGPTAPASAAWDSLATATASAPAIWGFGTLSSDSTAANPIRQQGLDLLQHARMLNLRPDDRSRRALDAVLAELQDRTCRLDQVPLRNLYNQAHHHVDDAWADQDIVRGLQQLQPLALRSRSIQVESRGLLVFIDWTGLALTPQELHSAGRVLNRLGGSVVNHLQGYRVCLPCSLRRMSCMAFMMGGRRYAVSAAQCPTAPLSLEHNAPADIRLSLRLGEQALTLQPDDWLGSRPMNIHPVPAGVTSPDGVSQVALDGEGQVYLWFDRAG